MIVKVCGNANADNIRAVAAAAPDMMGFIFFAPSPRNALGVDAAEVRALPDRIARVGVFVNANIDEMEDACQAYGITRVQLHGSESPNFCRDLRQRGYTVMKAFGIASASDIHSLSAYADCVDAFVLDTKTAAHGGSGRKFDWSVLDAYRYDVPFLLSGGIGPDDVTAIASISHQCMIGVDVNSKFEIAPGLKDASLLNKFINQIKRLRL